MNTRPFRAAALLAAAVLICVLCNTAAFWIDTPRMRENARQGVTMLGEQDVYPQMVGGFMSTRQDNFTSVLILKTAAYTGDEPLAYKAFGGYRTELPAQEGQDAWEAICTYADGSESPTGGLSYSRYWHGYTLPLRLLLCALNVSNIQMLLYFVQLALAACVLLKMRERALGTLIPGFFTAYFLLVPMAMGICIQYMTASLPMLAACVLLLHLDEKIERAVSLPAFFALVGLLTNYFDLLTFPLVTLGFPLVLLLALRLKADASARQLFALAFWCCAGWGIGFAGMWVFKWILNGFVFGWGQLGGVLSQAMLRVSSESGANSFSRFDALRMNLDVILSKKSYLLLGLGAGLATLLPAGRAIVRREGVKADPRALLLLLPAAVAFAWCIVMANHSYDHTFYTYRNLMVAVASGYAALACLLRPSGKGRKSP